MNKPVELDTIFTAVCPCCGRAQQVQVRLEDLNEFRYTNTRNIQQIFWYLKPSQRELFLTGICEVCWCDVFGDEDDEDEE